MDVIKLYVSEIYAVSYTIELCRFKHDFEDMIFVGQDCFITILYSIDILNGGTLV